MRLRRWGLIVAGLSLFGLAGLIILQSFGVLSFTRMVGLPDWVPDRHGGKLLILLGVAIGYAGDHLITRAAATEG